MTEALGLRQEVALAVAKADVDRVVELIANEKVEAYKKGYMEAITDTIKTLKENN